MSANGSGLDLKAYTGVFLSGSRVLCVPVSEGHHRNIENLNEAQTKHDELADCLGIAAEKKYVYNEDAGSFKLRLFYWHDSQSTLT